MVVARVSLDISRALTKFVSVITNCTALRACILKLTRNSFETLFKRYCLIQEYHQIPFEVSRSNEMD